MILYEDMINEIKEYLNKERNKVYTGEGERIIKDIQGIIENYEEEE